MLEVSKGQFSSFQPHLLSIVLHGTTHRFSAGYIEEFRWAMGPEDSKRLTVVREFAAREVVAGIIRAEVGSVRHRIRNVTRSEESGSYIESAGLEDILQLGHTTVMNWKDQGIIDTYVPQGHHARLHIPVPSFNAIAHWHYPEPRVADPSVHVA